MFAIAGAGLARSAVVGVELNGSLFLRVVDSMKRAPIDVDRFVPRVHRMWIQTEFKFLAWFVVDQQDWQSSSDRTWHS